MKVHYFATAVYEMVKVLRFINRQKIFLFDIKPANIFVCQEGNKQVFKFADIDMAFYCNEECDENVPVVATLIYHA